MTSQPTKRVKLVAPANSETAVILASKDSYSEVVAASNYLDLMPPAAKVESGYAYGFAGELSGTLELPTAHEVEDCSQLIDLTDLPPMSLGGVLNALSTTYYGELPMLARGPQGEGLMNIEAPNAPYVTLDLRGSGMFVRLHAVQGIAVINSDASQAPTLGFQYGKLQLGPGASPCQIPADGAYGLDALLAQCVADGLSDCELDLSGNAYGPTLGDDYTTLLGRNVTITLPA